MTAAHDILHISDLHFGPPYHEQVGGALLAAATELDPDLVIISGDLTQRARPEQFAAARGFLGQLPSAPQVVVPGNHDVPLYRVWERLVRPRDQYRRHIADKLDRVHHFQDLVVVALDSTAPHRAIVNGRIHRTQLDLCDRVFRDLPATTLKAVVAHHHFVPAPDWEADKAMPQAKRALDRFVDLKVDLIFGGHLHRGYIGNTLDVYTGKDPDHGIIVIQCGTTTSRRGRGREREKNSFNHVRIEGDMLQVTHHLYFEQLGHFAPASRHHFPRPGRQFVATPPAASD